MAPSHKVEPGYVEERADLLPWTDPDWLREATEWVEARLEEHGTRVEGALDQFYVRPWSTVLRVPTSRGDLYFKAAAPVQAYEVPLTLELARRRPDCVASVLAADVDRGWLLMPDGGTRLREVIQTRDDVIHWSRALPLYAELQIDLAADATGLLALGVTDQRLAGLPAQYEQLLTSDALAGLSDHERARLRDLAAWFAAACAELAAHAIPETIQHDDLREANVFVRDGRYLFLDWGDSCISHPFHTLVAPLAAVADRFKLVDGDPLLARLRDAYLEPWERFASRDAVVEAFALAQPVGTFGRALTSHRIDSAMEPAFTAKYAHALPAKPPARLYAVA